MRIDQHSIASFVHPRPLGIDLEHKVGTPEYRYPGVDRVFLMNPGDGGKLVEAKGRLINIQPHCVDDVQELHLLSFRVYHYIQGVLAKAISQNSELKGVHLYFGGVTQDTETEAYQQTVGFLLWQ